MARRTTRTRVKTYEADFEGRKVRVTVPGDYDAYDERRQLAHALAAWKTIGFIDSTKAKWWYRRARRLARACRKPFSQVMDDLEADAAAIMAEDE